MSRSDRPDPPIMQAESSGPRTIRISAKAVRLDIRGKMSDAALMEKYGISAKNLERIKRTLVANRLLTEEEVSNQGGPAAPTGKRVQANQFVADFRKFPDDFFLMKKYSLNPRQLQKVYDSLLDKNLISEFEFHCRVGQAPELEEPGTSRVPPAASTVVSLIEKNVDEITDRFTREDDDGLPQSFYKDHSGITLGRATRKDKTSEPGPRPLIQLSTVVEVLTEACPKCGKPKDCKSPQSCPHCGVVYAKYKGHRR
ncbi:MAG: hypothetical protein AB1646_03035 [Thermodesulfobacteriota bacterium]